MISVFPKPILNLPKAKIPIEGVKAHILQGEKQQLIFMEFEKDTIITEHSHESQWEIVLEGKVEYWEDNIKHIYKKGDRFFVQKDKKHHAKVYAGYSSIAFFNQKDRYKKE